MDECKMVLTMTPVDNVNNEKKAVIDNGLISTKEYDWEKEVQIFNVTTGNSENVLIKNISLYDHRLNVNGDLFHLLHALSK